MNKNTKVRIIRNQMRKFADGQNEDFEMFSAMDGSGECGKFFWDAEEKSQDSFLGGLLGILGITKDEYITELKAIITVEEKFTRGYPELPYDEMPRAYNDLCICS